jgi:alpha-N-arabinofuranosidase
MILAGTATIPYAVRAPDLPRDPRPGTRLNGNFTETDGFDSTALRPTWLLMRTPREQWFDLTSHPGWLTMRARPFTLEGRGQPSFVGRRQQHTNATATTTMQWHPRAAGDKAGITTFQSSNAWFLLSVTLADGHPVVQLEQRSAGSQPNAPATTQILASAPLAATDTAIALRITARGAAYDFAYATRPGQWRVLKADADGSILSTKSAGGFVGTLFGLYAYHSQP